MEESLCSILYSPVSSDGTSSVNSIGRQNETQMDKAVINSVTNQVSQFQRSNVSMCGGTWKQNRAVQVIQPIWQQYQPQYNSPFFNIAPPLCSLAHKQVAHVYQDAYKLQTSLNPPSIVNHNVYCKCFVNHLSPLSGNHKSGLKRKRMSYKPHQVAVLVKEYSINRYITSHKMQELGILLDLDPKQVKVWFQNRRMKEKNDKKRTSIETCIKEEADTSIIKEERDVNFYNAENLGVAIKLEDIISEVAVDESQFHC